MYPTAELLAQLNVTDLASLCSALNDSLDFGDQFLKRDRATHIFTLISDGQGNFSRGFAAMMIYLSDLPTYGGTPHPVGRKGGVYSWDSGHLIVRGGPDDRFFVVPRTAAD